MLANSKGFVGLETGFDYGDALAGGGVGLRHQVHADHEAARNDAGEADRLVPRPDFVPIGCPNCPRCHRLTGKRLQNVALCCCRSGTREIWDLSMLSQAGPPALKGEGALGQARQVTDAVIRILTSPRSPGGLTVVHELW